MERFLFECFFKRLGALGIGGADDRIAQSVERSGGVIRQLLEELVAVIRVVIGDQELRVFFLISRVFRLQAQDFFPGLSRFFGIGRFELEGEVAQNSGLLAVQGVESLVNCPRSL